MQRATTCLFVTQLLVTAMTAATAQQQARISDDGANLYKEHCGHCHSLDSDGIGPRHRNVFGRRAGSVEGYEYSQALSRSQLVFDEKTLDLWLTAPTTLVPGTDMRWRVGDPNTRSAIIEYLRDVATSNE